MKTKIYVVQTNVGDKKAFQTSKLANNYVDEFLQTNPDFDDEISIYQLDYFYKK